MRVDSVASELRAAPAGTLRDRYLAFVGEHGDAALWRAGGSEHLTASCFVFSPDLAHVLLCHHRKGEFWVQFGGHLEPDDPSLAASARREAREESGIPDLELSSSRIVDLDRHDLHGGFSCAAHWDVGFVAVVPRDTETTVSDESDDVRWFPVDALPDALPDGFARRLEGVLSAVRDGVH
ncbi:NUDIX domain-containing protein [Curtobacterium sp. PhB136]|uniref:NUDIX hydrolase n=1 Tax=Curtobacterium sp. PhB136 TaxID=2485181 RepID=UPI00104B72CD|nr:NUDIX domain-containing protein [Curtobacterium sp. PhB136]TCK61330.1 8-oxo-dGTP pyrophosphatase MutT (NUDIX family) [Curtobacterium sp. PhB136]